jgi:hypothetical protein
MPFVTPRASSVLRTGTGRAKPSARAFYFFSLRLSFFFWRDVSPQTPLLLPFAPALASLGEGLGEPPGAAPTGAKHVVFLEGTIMTEKAKEILDGLVANITAEKAVAFVRERLFSDGIEIPCRNWSFLNQFVTFLSGTADARGYRQWQEAGRQVKKGARAVYILVPMIYKIKAGENEEDKETLKGFKAMPVFRVEDTEGPALDYQKRLAEFDPESLPLIDIARSLGITVSAGLTGSASGCYTPSLHAITMGCDDGQVFLHELSHAVDHVLPGHKDDYAFNEVVAELSSAYPAACGGVSHFLPAVTKIRLSSMEKTCFAFFTMSFFPCLSRWLYSFLTSFDTLCPMKISSTSSPNPSLFISVFQK